MEKQEQCNGCPWRNPETCGACKADIERRGLDKERENGKNKYRIN